jgi:hypothetical protein
MAAGFAYSACPCTVRRTVKFRSGQGDFGDGVAGVDVPQLQQAVASNHRQLPLVSNKETGGGMTQLDGGHDLPASGRVHLQARRGHIGNPV